MHPLDGCRARLDRAEKHLDTLHDEMKIFLEGDKQTFTVEFDSVDQSYVVHYKELQEIPLYWGIALGDVVHNIRSALDNLVYQLVLLAGAEPHGIHQFPITDHPNEWITKVEYPPECRKLGALDFIDPRYVAFIKSLQPYEPATGIPMLAVIRRFSNTDKHRLIHAARASLTASPKLEAFLGIPATIFSPTYKRPGTPVEDGAEIARFKTSTDLRLTWNSSGEIVDVADSKMNVHAELPMTTVFGKPGAEDTRTKDFREVLEDVRGIVASFAAEFCPPGILSLQGRLPA